MHLIFFSAADWVDWDLGSRPLIPEGMPVLVDDDLRFEDDSGPRPAVVANQWLRERPINKAPSPRSWKNYAQALKAWLEFLGSAGVHPFGSREDLRAALAGFAEFRLSGPFKERWDVATWNQNVNTVARFYDWAVDEGYCAAVPFTYSTVHRYTEAGLAKVRRNNATRRRAKAHVTLKYLEPEFRGLFLNALAGLRPDGEPDSFRGHHLGRNAAMGRLVVSSGLRSQEFTHLLRYELPPIPLRDHGIPVPFPLSAQITKGKKPRETWVDFVALTEVWQYIELDRAGVAAGRPYVPAARLGDSLAVSEPDWEGGKVAGRRRSWRQLTLAERMRLVDGGDGAPGVIALQSDGTPFVDWATVFRRTSERIRRDFEPRFPSVTPHTLRHTFAMETLAKLVKGYYQRAAALVEDTDDDAALALYLTKQDPLLILRDLLGHTSVTTTEIYVQRLDVQRIYRELYAEVGRRRGLGAAEAEAGAEFDGDEEFAW